MRFKTNAIAIAISAIALTVVPIHLISAVCSNRGASNSDEINSQCSACLCINGSWTFWFFASNTNACSGTVYGDDVKTDIACGSTWTIAYIPITPESGQPVIVNCDSAPFTGNCDFGNCVGTLGPTGPMQQHLLLITVPCIPAGCGGA
jgi:hypothetical protein